MSVKKITYLHGLESRQGGKKVDFLSSKGYVFAPKMGYKTNPNLFSEILEKLKKEGKPDLIIGSSMGGYFAYMLASHFKDVEVILFNPALKERSVEFEGINKGEYKVKGTLALSENDDVVIPSMTLKHLEEIDEIGNFSIEEMKDIGHQIPIHNFCNIYTKHHLK